MNNFAEQYGAATKEFIDLVDSLSESQLDNSDSEGWSPRQVIHHMADSEAQSYARLRRLVAEPSSIIQGYDEGKWAENSTLGYKELPIDNSLAVIKSVRRSSLELIRRLDERQLDNSGTHTELGNYSIRNWLETYIKHPKDHSDQIRNQVSTR
mgnify:CR=1 FL=1